MKTTIPVIICVLLGAVGCSTCPDGNDFDEYLAHWGKMVDIHNRAMTDLSRHPTAVRIVSIREDLKAGDSQTMVVTNEVNVADGGQLRRIFKNLKTEDRSVGATIHGCRSNVSFHFTFNGEPHKVSLDHGIWIHSTLMPGVGVRCLPMNQSADIFRILRELGFKERDMGINK